MSFGFLLAAAAATTPTQNYRLTNYPDDGQGCVAAKEAVADRFTAMTRLPVKAARAYCDDRTGTCTLSLDYEAARSLAVEMTGTPLSQTSTYASLAACESDLATQSQLFATYTRVPAAFAYCYGQAQPLDLGLSDGQVGLHIEGFGTGVEHYELETIDLQASFGAGAGDQVGTTLAAQGLHLARASIKNEIGADTIGPIAPSLEIAYYAATPAKFDAVVAWSGSDGACAETLGQAQELLQAAGVAPFLAYCSPYSGASYAGSFVHFLNDGHVRISDGPTGYASQETCEADAPRVVAAAQPGTGWRAVGAVCGIGWHGVEMQVVSTNR